jgi:hypothetical protein
MGIFLLSCILWRPINQTLKLFDFLGFTLLVLHGDGSIAEVEACEMSDDGNFYHKIISLEL